MGEIPSFEPNEGRVKPRADVRSKNWQEYWAFVRGTSEELPYNGRQVPRWGTVPRRWGAEEYLE